MVIYHFVWLVRTGLASFLMLSSITTADGRRAVSQQLCKVRWHQAGKSGPGMGPQAKLPPKEEDEACPDSPVYDLASHPLCLVGLSWAPLLHSIHLFPTWHGAQLGCTSPALPHTSQGSPHDGEDARGSSGFFPVAFIANPPLGWCNRSSGVSVLTP